MKSTFPGTGSKAARVEAEAKAEAAEAEALASTRYGAQRVRSTVTLDLAGREKGLDREFGRRCGFGNNGGDDDEEDDSDDDDDDVGGV